MWLWLWCHVRRGNAQHFSDIIAREENTKNKDMTRGSLTATILLGRVCRVGDLEGAANLWDCGGFAVLECFAGDDSIDLCGGVSGCEIGRGRGSGIPVRMFWNASSTFVASSADVSINERWFSATPRQHSPPPS